MKVALLADIHANLPALNSIVKSKSFKSCDMVIVAGDLIGYYFWPSQVIEIIIECADYVIAGNHEEMLTQGLADREMLLLNSRKYGSGLQKCLSDLSTTQLLWLQSLPQTQDIRLDEGSILVCHGSVIRNDEYVYPDSPLDPFIDYLSMGTKWVVSGHTHYPMHRIHKGVAFINPGSVGQPRNGEKGAHWAVLNTELNTVDFHIENYDYISVATIAQNLHPEIPYLSNVLLR